MLEKKIDKMTPSSKMLKKFVLVFVLTFSNIVYLIPYLSLDFYNQFLQAYGLTDGQLGTLITFFGFTAVPGYLIGGWLADVFDPRKMVALSCILTSAVAVAVSFSTSYPLLLFLYFLYGITSTMLNWGAYLKLIRMLGDDDEQGRLYGSADIAYGLFSLFIEYVVLFVTATYLINHPMGFKLAILLYAGLSLVIGVAIIFAVPQSALQKDVKPEGSQDVIRFNLIGKVMKLPLTWYLSFFTLGYFIIRSTIPYLNPYLTDAFGVSITFAAAFTLTIRTVAISTMSPLGGWIRDKMGRSTPLVIVGSLGSIVFSLVLAFIPQMASMTIPVMTVGMITLISVAALTNCLYTPVSEGKVPIAYTGTILGIASAIGYSSDIWLYSLCGHWLDTLGNAGYVYIWYLTAGGGVLMLAMGVFLWKYFSRINEANQVV